jgi:hypothetical protein
MAFSHLVEQFVVLVLSLVRRSWADTYIEYRNSRHLPL